MAGRGVTLILGIIFYVMGIILVNVFLEPAAQDIFFHPAVELIIISMAIFILSSFFYGRLSFILLLFAGLFLGSLFTVKPIFVTLALLPMLLGLLGGRYMGETAKKDLKGKKNFFEEKESYIAYVILILITSAIIGYFFGGYIALELPPGF